MDTARSVGASLWVGMRYAARWPRPDRTRIEKIINQASGYGKYLLERDFSELKRGEKSIYIYSSILLTNLYCIKSTWFISRSVSLINYSEMESNFQVLVSDENQTELVRFVCMTTNCSRLSTSNSLMDDMSQLPVFVVCESLSALYWDPIKYLGEDAIFVYGVLASIIAVSMIIPIMQLISPKYNDCCVFLQTPRLAIALLRDRMDEVVARSSLELEAHRQHHRRQQFDEHERDAELYDIDLIRDLPEQSNDKQGASDRGLYLPIVRSEWFHRRLTLFNITLVTSTIISAIFFGLFLIRQFVGPRVEEKSNLLAQFNANMRLLKCAIWLTDSPTTFVNLTSFDLSWNLPGSIEFLGIPLMSIFVAIIGLLGFYSTIFDLVCWQAELQNQLLFLAEFKRLSKQHWKHQINHQARRFCNHLSPSSPNQTALMLANLMLKRLGHEFKLANSSFVSLMKTNLIQPPKYNDTRSSRWSSNSALAIQEFSLNSIKLIDLMGQNIDPDGVHSLLMEKIYTNFCLYLDVMNNYIPCLSVIISISYVFLYGMIILASWYCAKITSENLNDLIIVVGVSLTYTVTVLLVCSIVHTKVS